MEKPALITKFKEVTGAADAPAGEPCFITLHRSVFTHEHTKLLEVSAAKCARPYSETTTRRGAEILPETDAQMLSKCNLRYGAPKLYMSLPGCNHDYFINPLFSTTEPIKPSQGQNASVWCGVDVCFNRSRSIILQTLNNF